MQRAPVKMTVTVDSELDDLRREFLAEARAKVDEMRSILRQPFDAESLDRLAYLTHQLKGSGGSYGYDRISAHAVALEETLENLPVRALDNSKILHHLTNLGTEIDQRAVELTGLRRNTER